MQVRESFIVQGNDVVTKERNMKYPIVERH